MSKLSFKEFTHVGHPRDSAYRAAIARALNGHRAELGNLEGRLHWMRKRGFEPFSKTGVGHRDQKSSDAVRVTKLTRTRFFDSWVVRKIRGLIRTEAMRMTLGG